MVRETMYRPQNKQLCVMLFSRTETVSGLVNNDNLNIISINDVFKDKWVKSTSTKRVTASLLASVSMSALEQETCLGQIRA